MYTSSIDILVHYNATSTHLVNIRPSFNFCAKNTRLHIHNCIFLGTRLFNWVNWGNVKWTKFETVDPNPDSLDWESDVLTTTPPRPSCVGMPQELGINHRAEYTTDKLFSPQKHSLLHWSDASRQRSSDMENNSKTLHFWQDNIICRFFIRVCVYVSVRLSTFLLWTFICHGRLKTRAKEFTIRLELVRRKSPSYSVQLYNYYYYYYSECWPFAWCISLGYTWEHIRGRLRKHRALMGRVEMYRVDAVRRTPIVIRKTVALSRRLSR